MVDYYVPNFLLFAPVCGMKLRRQENRVSVDYKALTTNELLSSVQ